jgi:deazaflavin-dependent oxidoreductase (nitroreductase family)
MSNFFNGLVIRFLQSPFHGLLSRNVMLITVTGHKSGKRYTTPVEYHHDDGLWTITSRRERTWWKNIQHGTPTEIHWRGQTIPVAGTVIIDDIAFIRQSYQNMYPRISTTVIEKLLPNLILVQLRRKEA